MKKLLLLIVITYAIPISAQTYIDTTYRMEVVTTAGPMFNIFRNPRFYGDNDKFSIGYGTSVRAMWHPGRLLSIGVMTGYYFISKSEVGSSNTKSPTATLSAVPMQIFISMRKKKFEVGLGVGPYMMRSTLNDGNNEATGTNLEMGIAFFGSYYFFLGDRIRIGPELRVLNLGFRGITSAMPSIFFQIEPIRY